MTCSLTGFANLVSSASGVKWLLTSGSKLLVGWDLEPVPTSSFFPSSLCVLGRAGCLPISNASVKHRVGGSRLPGLALLLLSNLRDFAGRWLPNSAPPFATYRSRYLLIFF